VLSLAFSTMFNSTTFSSSRRRLQRANPPGAGEQVRAINFASAAPSKIRGRAEFGLYLRVSAASRPSSTSRCRVRPILLMLVSSASEIALSLQPSPASETSAFSRMRAFVSDCAGCLPAQIIASSRSRSSALNFTTYFLTAISLPATNHLHRRIAVTEIQKNTTDSMTPATRELRIFGFPAGLGKGPARLCRVAGSPPRSQYPDAPEEASHAVRRDENRGPCRHDLPRLSRKAQRALCDLGRRHHEVARGFHRQARARGRAEGPAGRKNLVRRPRRRRIARGASRPAGLVRSVAAARPGDRKSSGAGHRDDRG